MPDALPTLPVDAITPAREPGAAPSARAKALLFSDPLSQALLDKAERLARSDASVLVTGETGTGKELLARRIHLQSGRRGPFIAVNCGAFAESLIDAELFGHEAGAFTGASQARAGWFEAAYGGTLFLDEIGDLPIGLQVKLLRVLQERQVVRLGSRKPIALDVRLVAATHVDLQQAVSAQRFRADLYYRLGVATLDLPPLRARPGDILPLARHFIDLYAPRLGQPQARLSEAAEHALLQHPWPGNIRELENVIHAALIISADGCVQPQDLPLAPLRAAPSLPQAPQPEPAPQLSPEAAQEPAPAAEPEALERLSSLLQDLLGDGRPELHRAVEERLVRAAFTHAGENQVRAARVLGITRNTLRTLLKRHGLLGLPAPAPRARRDGFGAKPLAH